MNQCPSCGYTRLPYDYANHGAAIKRGHAEAILKGKKLGRKRRLDHSLIREMRATGMSVRGIAKELNCSRGLVEHALRVKT